MPKNIENSGIYVDARNMYKELYSNAFYKMSKTDRILIGDRMLTMNERLIADISMAYHITEDKQKYIEIAIAQFESLKEILRLASELSIISDSKTKLRIFEFIGRIDEGIYKWHTSANRRHDVKVK